jgi:16S rRNA G966 N2-methylase RsmD
VPEAPFGSAIIDPPYDQVPELIASLGGLAARGAGWLDGEAIVVAKHFWRAELPDASGVLELLRRRRFGETALSVYRRGPQSAAGGS